MYIILCTRDYGKVSFIQRCPLMRDVQIHTYTDSIRAYKTVSSKMTNMYVVFIIINCHNYVTRMHF